MIRYRLLWSVVASTLSIVLLVVSIAAAQDPSQSVARSSSAQDPFQAAEKSAAKGETRTSAAKAEPRSEYVRKSAEEWMKILPHEVFMVTRLKATEPAFSGKYAVGHFNGTFHCACCDAALFSSKAKFDSGTGWPSFFQPISRNAIGRAPDYSEAPPRMEVMCRRCGAHLGHVFNDAPETPTGLRFCINSLSLKLKRNGVEVTGTRAASSSRGRTRSRVRSTRSRSRGKSSSMRAKTKAPAETAGDDPAPAEKTTQNPAGKKTDGD